MLDQLRGMQLAVDSPAAGVLVVRVAGRLAGDTGPRLLRLLDGLAGREAAGGRRPTRLVVDLGNVAEFDADGVAVLAHARQAAARRGVRFVLDGVDAGRLDLLPRRIELALRRLGAAPVPPGPPPAGEVLSIP
jgi:anti-anti-sigma regulatory factor